MRNCRLNFPHHKKVLFPLICIVYKRDISNLGNLLDHNNYGVKCTIYDPLTVFILIISPLNLKCLY